MYSTQHKHLILASASPRRKQLLSQLGLPFTVQASDTDETISEFLRPAPLVETLAQRKAQSIANRIMNTDGDSIVIGADTVVVLDGNILGKPQDNQDSKRMLTALQGREHQVYSGIALIDSESGQVLAKHRMTTVNMKQLSDRQIANYIATKEPADKAGAYAIQGIGATLIESIDGDYFNVVGLSLSLLSDMLSEMGVDIL